MLQPDYCRQRQERLLRRMQDQDIALALLANPKTIYYLSGALVDATLPQALLLADNGDSLLITNSEPKTAAVTRVAIYTAYTIKHHLSRTTMLDEMCAIARDLSDALLRGRGGVALEAEFAPFPLAEAVRAATPARPMNLTPMLADLRRVKDPDELEAIGTTTRLVERGYAAVKARLEPGMTEFQVYTIFSEAIIHAAATSVWLTGDFACGARAIRGGGAPTDRVAQRGDLFILDIFPLYQGYLCDLCRTFAVTPPSQLQQDAWAHILQAHEIAQRMIRPGVPTRDVYEEIRNHLEKFQPCRGSFHHHAGHGLGMDGWELPWLTPSSDHVIRQGEVLACEPALYGENLQGGIRLEHNYLVGSDGVTALDAFPMDL